MNRFWKVVLTGTAAGAVLGILFYAKSRMGSGRVMMEDSSTDEIAGRIKSRVMRTTNRFAKDIGREVTRAGRTMQRLGKRLSLGGVD